MANIIPRREELRAAPTALWRDPFEAMRDLFRLDPFLEMGALATGGTAFVPAFEVKETKDAYVFRADLPGVKEEDVDLSLTGNRLTIGGKREAEQKTENDRYFAYERSYGSFSRSFTLPEGIDKDNVQADMKNGVLNVIIAKKPEVQPKKISLTAGTGRKDEKARA